MALRKRCALFGSFGLSSLIPSILRAQRAAYRLSAHCFLCARFSLFSPLLCSGSLIVMALPSGASSPGKLNVCAARTRCSARLFTCAPVMLSA